MIDKFLDTHNAKIPKCCESGTNCSVTIPWKWNTHILKGETLSNNKFKICDCIVFRIEETVEIVVIELKSKTFNVTKVKEKLENGAREVLKIINEHHINKACLCPVLAAKSFPPSAVSQMKGSNGNIKIRKRQHRIKYLRCGGKLDTLQDGLRPIMQSNT